MNFVCLNVAGISTEVKADKPSKSEESFRPWWPLLHLLATFGNYNPLKVFLSLAHDGHFDEDKDQNNPLHCVMRDVLSFIRPRDNLSIDGIQFQTHLLD